MLSAVVAADGATNSSTAGRLPLNSPNQYWPDPNGTLMSDIAILPIAVVAVAAVLSLPLGSLLSVTTTDSVLPTSASVGVYVDVVDPLPAALLPLTCHW